MGSIQQTKEGKSFLVAGSNVSIVSESNGQVIISSTGGGGELPDDASYLVLSNDVTLSDERALDISTGLLLDDAGAGSTATLSINDSVAATVSGTRFANNITVVGTGTFEFGISGSLTRLADGRSFLVSGSNITIVSESNGQITINSVGGGSSPDKDASFLTISSESSLTNERVFTPGTGLLLTDAGAGSTATLSINDSQVATVSGTRFTGVVAGVAGFSGSLTRLTTGESWIAGSTNVLVTTGSTGQITTSLSQSLTFDPVIARELMLRCPSGAYSGAGATALTAGVLYCCCQFIRHGGVFDSIAISRNSATDLSYTFYIWQYTDGDFYKSSVDVPLICSFGGLTTLSGIQSFTDSKLSKLVRGYVWTGVSVDINESVIGRTALATNLFYNTAAVASWPNWAVTDPTLSSGNLVLGTGTTASFGFPTLRLYKA
jgi:hypothetical protein